MLSAAISGAFSPYSMPASCAPGAVGGGGGTLNREIVVPALTLLAAQHYSTVRVRVGTRSVPYS